MDAGNSAGNVAVEVTLQQIDFSDVANAHAQAG